MGVFIDNKRAAREIKSDLRVINEDLMYVINDDTQLKINQKLQEIKKLSNDVCNLIKRGK